MTHHFLELSRPRLMGILNVTPDSFSDGGLLYKNDALDLGLACDRVAQLAAQGAEIIDVGGESTRPGAKPVSLQEELDRVIPVVEWTARHLDVAISVDTSSPEVILEAARSGANLINDIRGLSREGAVEAVAKTGLSACLMHMQGTPETMQNNPVYQNVVADVSVSLRDRVATCLNAGIVADRLWLDPGFGFGKTLDHNLALLRNLPELVGLGFPVLVGFSRKSMVGKLLGRELRDRLPGSLALAMMALERGAKVLRVHDVAATRDIIDVFMAVEPDSLC